jgi:Leucine-rich repeat (LRR) protein
LKALLLDKNELTEIPALIANLENLESLALRENLITRIPDEIGNLEHLIELDLGLNKVVNIPDSLLKSSRSKHILDLDLEENIIEHDEVQRFNALASDGKVELYAPRQFIFRIMRARSEILERLKKVLNDWIIREEDEYLPIEINSRIEAKRRILECFKDNSDSLNLDGLDLTSLPNGIIAKLNHLRVLNLEGNQLTEIPAEIGKLKELIFLNLDGNELTQVPAEIWNLTRLKTLFLKDNQLTQIPVEIGNLKELEHLHLEGNSLITTLPDSLFNPDRVPKLNLNLINTGISPDEELRLNTLIQNSRVELYIGAQQQDQDIAAKIIAKAPKKRRESLKIFLEESTELESFKIFLGKCSEADGWRSNPANREKMTKALSRLVCAMSQNDALKERCEAIATQASESCGDRVTFYYAKMLLAQNNERIPIAEMNDIHLFNYARQEAVVKFLDEEATKRVTEIEKANDGRPFLEEIETHLAYLQAAPRLGLKLPAIGMLYRNWSGVSEETLDIAVAEFNSQSIHLIAEYIFNDEGGLRNHPAVDGLIAEAREREFASNDKSLEEEFKDSDKSLEEIGDPNATDSSSIAGGAGIQVEKGGLLVEARNYMSKYKELMVKEIENFLERIMETSSALSSPKPAAMASGEELNLPILAQDSATNRQIGDDADTRMVASELQLNEGAIQARELPSNAPRNTTLPPNTFASDREGGR